MTKPEKIIIAEFIYGPKQIKILMNLKFYFIIGKTSKLRYRISKYDKMHNKINK